MSILTEITCKEYRSYFISTHYLAALLGSVVISQIIAINLDWKVFYLSLAGTLVLVNIPNVFLTRSNPVFLIGVKKDFETAKINSKFILEMNKPHSEEKDLVLPEEKLSLYFKEIDDLQISTTEKNYSSNKVDEEEHQITSVQDFNSDLNEKIDSEFMIVFKMQITFIFHLLMIFLTVYEIKIFGDNKYKKQISLAMNINIGCQILGTIIFSYLMNSKYIGRKYSYIILVTSFICIRLYNLFAKDLSLIRFFILRLCINLSHSSCNTLIFESFTNKLRVKYYGQIFFVGKIFVFFVPYIYEFTTHFEYEIINIVVGILAILNMLIFIKETHGKVLVD